MLDFNHRPKFHEQVGSLIDDALALERDAQTRRDYLGASRLGVACERALQYLHACTLRGHAASRAMGQCHHAIDVRKVSQG